MDFDAAYANRDHVPDVDKLIGAWEEEARQWREAEAAFGRARLNHPYGEGERRALDFFHPAGRAEGLAVFVHGGYWRTFDRTYWSHFTAGLTTRGWAVAVPSYTIAPEGTIAGMTLEIARAVEVAAKLVPGPIRLTGHSAGGHLAARMNCADVEIAAPVAARIARIVPISPVTDLRPIAKTKMNEDLRLDEAAAEAESPILKETRGVPTTVWVGAEELPAFLDQARWLEEAWPEAELMISPGRHHFDVIDPLKDAESDLIASILA